MEHMRARVNGETAEQHEDEKVEDGETKIRVERHSEKFQHDLTLCLVLLTGVGHPQWLPCINSLSMWLVAVFNRHFYCVIYWHSSFVFPTLAASV